MAVSTKSGSFTGSNATGNQAVTGVGFQPKFLVLMTNALTADTPSTTNRFCLGFASGASDAQAFDIRTQNSQTTMNTARTQQSGKILSIANLTTDTLALSATLASFDSDGFTINWANATNAIIHYYAIGGSDFSAKVGRFDMNGSTGNQAVTGVGFQPKAVMFFGTIDNTTEGAQANGKLTMGCATATNKRWAYSLFDQDNVPDSVVKEYFTESKCIVRTSNSAVTLAADLVSLDSDGFTVNITTALACRMAYVAFGGTADYHAGTVTQPTSTGTVAETGVGFTPQGAMFAGGGAASLDTITAHAFPIFGCSDSSRQEEVLASQIKDASALSDGYRDMGSGVCIERSLLSVGSIVTSAEMQSYDADGFTLNWTLADSTQSIIGYLAFRAAAAAAVVQPFVFVVC